jgi:CheY-like chemotaxis protein
VSEQETSHPRVLVVEDDQPIAQLIERYFEVTGGQPIPIIVVSAAGAVPRSMQAYYPAFS